MFDQARYRRAARRSWRALHEHYGRRAAMRVLLNTRGELAAGNITELDAEALLDTLATGDLSGLADHPAYNDEPHWLYFVEPDGTRHAFHDPRYHRPGQRGSAIDKLGGHALEGSRTIEARPALGHLLDRVRQLAIEGAQQTIAEEQSKQERARALARNGSRGPDRIEPLVSRAVSALVSAARPGPFTGVVPVSV